MTEARCGIYARISSDPSGLALGVQRQLDDCTAEASRRGWTIVDRFVDNDVSATRSKLRPEYQRMIREIESGRITALVVWDVDRLTRTPRELEDIIDLADRRGLALASVGGEIDLSSPQGRMTARIKGSVARHETDQQSRRLRRKMRERAESGQPHSFAAYGYRRVIVTDESGRRIGARDELIQDQADTVRTAARLILGGQSLRSVVAHLNQAGSTSARGLPWSSTTLRQVLTRPRNAGLREHRGEVIGPGQWPPIYDRATHDRVVAMLTDPERRSNRGSQRRHLLTGIARCGRDGCDGRMVVNAGRISGGKRQPPAYVCQACTRVRRKQESVDELVEAIMVARLQLPDAAAALATGDHAATQRAQEEAAGLEARLDLAADEFADGNLTGAQLRRITEKLRPKIEAAKAAATANMPRAGLLGMIGRQAPERWAAASLDVKRALIEALMTVTILPSGPGKPFDPSLICVEWRSDRRGQ